MYDIFRQLCQEKGVSTYKVCKDLGISQGTISNWKKGRNNLSNDVLKKIADYFGVTMDYLMSGNIVWNPSTQEMWVEGRKNIIKAIENANGNKETEMPPAREYYFDAESGEIAEFLFENPEYRVLFDASRKVRPEDVKKVAAMIKAFTTEEDND